MWNTYLIPFINRKNLKFDFNLTHAQHTTQFTATALCVKCLTFHAMDHWTRTFGHLTIADGGMEPNTPQ